MSLPDKGTLRAAFEPLIAIHYGWKHHQRIPDEEERRSVSGLYKVTTGLATLGGIFAGSTALLPPHVDTNALLWVGKLAMFVAGTYSTRVLYDFSIHGREAMKRHERLSALTGRSFNRE